MLISTPFTRTAVPGEDPCAQAVLPSIDLEETLTALAEKSWMYARATSLGGSGNRPRLMARPTILIADDDPVFVASVESVLRTRYDVTTASSGSEAMAIGSICAGLKFYAGYPMSTESCFVGGNVAENAGGGRAIKYGVTGRYVLGLEVVLPGGEVYSALDKGVINTSDWATPSMNNRMGFYEIAKYTNYPGFHSMPLGDFTVNMKEWNKLPDDIKAILESAEVVYGT